MGKIVPTATVIFFILERVVEEKDDKAFNALISYLTFYKSEYDFWQCGSYTMLEALRKACRQEIIRQHPELVVVLEEEEKLSESIFAQTKYDDKVKVLDAFITKHGIEPAIIIEEPTLIMRR